MKSAWRLGCRSYECWFYMVALHQSIKASREVVVDGELVDHILLLLWGPYIDPSTFAVCCSTSTEVLTHLLRRQIEGTGCKSIVKIQNKVPTCRRKRPVPHCLEDISLIEILKEIRAGSAGHLEGMYNQKISGKTEEKVAEVSMIYSY